MGIKNKWLGFTLILLVMYGITYLFLSFLIWDFCWVIDHTHYGNLARALHVVITYIYITSKAGGAFMVKLAKMIKG